MLIQLVTGKTITLSAYEYYFLLDEKDVDQFFQSCIADDLGSYMENPFCSKPIQEHIEIDDIPEDIKDVKYV